jgi:hypothetical protein
MDNSENFFLRETCDIGYTRRRKTKLNHNAICVEHHYRQSKFIVLLNMVLLTTRWITTTKWITAYSTLKLRFSSLKK